MKQKVVFDIASDYEITPERILFFDMDGTLVDTNLVNFLSYKKAITSVTRSEFNLKYNSGMRFNRIELHKIMPHLTDIDLKSIIKEKERCYHEFLPKAKINDKVVALLYKYSKTNRTVLVTQSRKERALATLNHFELLNQFDDLFYGEIAENGTKLNKYQNAISKLGVPADLVIAFENEEAEITEAKLAGVQTINPISL